MEEKRGSSRTKRNKKHDEGKWDCSVCTFQNPVEAFKCEMCDVRKGTSTRKPRLNPHLVAQVAQQYAPPPPPKKEKLSKKERKELSNSASGSSSHSSRLRSPRLKNIDRTSAQHMAVTVNNVTVIITDYKPKIQNSNSSSTNSVNTSNTSDREDDDESLDESEDAASDAETDKDESSPRLKNIDRTSAQHMAVTVNNVTVIITDYKPKIQNSNSSSTNSVNTSNTSDREDDDESLDESEDAASDAETDKDES